MDDHLRAVRILWRRRMGQEPAPLRPEEIPAPAKLTALAATLLAAPSGKRRGRRAGITADERRAAAETALELVRECVEVKVLARAASKQYWTKSDRKDEASKDKGPLAYAYAEKHGFTLPDVAGAQMPWKEAVMKFFPWEPVETPKGEQDKRFRDSEVRLEREVRKHQPLEASGWKPDVDHWKHHGFYPMGFIKLVAEMEGAELAEEDWVRMSHS